MAERHQKITKGRGPIIANGVMRTVEKRRDTALTPETAPKWYKQLHRFDNVVRREFHWFTLLSSSRPGNLKRAKWEHLDVRRRVVDFPDPRGGADRAFDLALSREMLRSLARARRAGRVMHPDHSTTWIFPAASATGHIAEHKEDRSVLSRWGGDLRQTWRTVAVAAGIGEMEAHLLPNHKLRAVSAGYVTKSALLGHLREAQERASSEIVRWTGSRKLKPQPDQRTLNR